MSQRLLSMIPVQLEYELATTLGKGLAAIHALLPKLVYDALLVNPSRDMPYHNNLHTALFIKSMLVLFQRENITDKKLQATLIAAAVFHDYDYKDTTNDWPNIESAVKAWRNYANDWHKIIYDNTLVERLIKATCLERELDDFDPEIWLKGLMRDADLLGWTFSEYRTFLFDGLKSEKNITPYDKDFLKHFRFYYASSVDLVVDSGLA